MNKKLSNFWTSLRVLAPLITKKDKTSIYGLLFLTLLVACTELALASSVAFLAAFFTSPADTLAKIPSVLGGIQSLAKQDTRYGIFLALSAVTLLVFLKNALSTVLQWRSTAVAESIGNAVRYKVMDFFSRAPYLWILSTGTPDMLFGLTAASHLGTSLVYMVQIANHIIVLIFFMIGLLAIAPIPAMILFATLLLSGQFIMQIVRRKMHTSADAVYNSAYAAHSLQQFGVHALKELRLYGRDQTLLAQYGQVLDQAKKNKSQQSIYLRLPSALLESCGFTALLGVLAFLIWVQDASVVRITGTMGFLAAAAWRLLPIGNRFLDHWGSFCSLSPYLAGAAQFIQEAARLQGQLTPQDSLLVAAPVSFTSHIHFDKVTFRYPGAATPALSSCSLSIAKGSMTGIVGLSGSGKSTFINILSGLLTPDVGSIRMDDTPLSLATSRVWLDKIGYVSQTPYIIDATLAENIALKDWGRTINRDRVMECCRMAALDFLDQLEHGIDTHLGERGLRLSGGQAQRVIIARALYGRPDLIIFDEATSSLDLKNEQTIHETITSLRDQATLVIIAHRLSSVQDCDSIIWLDHGFVREKGPAETVLAQYRKILCSCNKQPKDT